MSSQAPKQSALHLFQHPHIAAFGNPGVLMRETRSGSQAPFAKSHRRFDTDTRSLQRTIVLRKQTGAFQKWLRASSAEVAKQPSAIHEGYLASFAEFHEQPQAFAMLGEKVGESARRLAALLCRLDAGVEPTRLSQLEITQQTWFDATNRAIDFSQFARTASEMAKFAAQATFDQIVEPSADEAVRRESDSIFARALSEDLQDGVETDFSKSLNVLVKMYGESAIDAIGRTIASGRFSTLVCAEALKYLGEVDDDVARFSRLELLVQCLRNSSPAIRDGASVGLALLDDPTAIEPMKSAIEAESCLELKEDMSLVLQQLEQRDA